MTWWLMKQHGVFLRTGALPRSAKVSVREIVGTLGPLTLPCLGVKLRRRTAP